ncbi:MAG: LysR family transcriptional regulator [Xanthomonadales bacterium]|nr:LysR family transcriptional regulator [Xanthomonadales bacterium]ODU93261.1 MAG: LysR family transcriptional regulator [Rhodanobacter sp. SCN 66-43]OJY82164.1 MAG: LysR family transcriptional regulator [Xanthomonadales bacterium 66-474]
MELRELETFRAVVESGGMNRAATRMNRAQSSITARIRQLESSLGVPLFEHEGRRLRLTAAGDVLVGYTDRLLALADETRAAVRRDKVCGRLRLGTMESVAASRLPRPLAGFHQRHPEISVELQTAHSRELLARLQAGTLDVAIVSDEVDDERFASVPWHVEELVLVAAAGDAVRDPRRMAGSTLLVFGGKGCAYRKRFEQWLQMLRVVPARELEFASYHAILAAAASGVGTGLIPRSVLDIYSQRDAVSVCKVPARIARVRTAVVTLRGRHVPALTLLVECLRDDFASARKQGGRKKRTTRAN